MSIQRQLLSFQPAYHEQTLGPEGATWVPVYNPARDCVVAECAQIEAEGGLVNSLAWKMPWRVRKLMLSQRMEKLGVAVLLWMLAFGVSGYLFLGCVKLWKLLA